MTKDQSTVIRYSNCFKQKVVRELEEEGISRAAIARRYGIKGGATIRDWLRKFGKNHLLNQVIRVEMKGEKDEVKRLEAELRKLKEAYADLSLKQVFTEKLIEIANAELKTDLKKNFGTKLSDPSREGTK